ncbi:MAG: enoyl-CoA hydratase/isomerase family protein [Acidobacteriota bacterium]
MTELSLPDVESLRVERHGPVLHVTLDRPGRRNALDLAMVDGLDALCRALAATPPEAIRAVVLRGAGGTFCAGGDLASFAADEPVEAGIDDPVEIANRTFGRCLLRLEQLPQPVVAVVEGAALGGGLGLVAVADVALAARDARLGMPEVHIGLVPSQVAPFVVRRIGSGPARRLAVTGAVVDGDEAAALGLVHEAADADALDDALDRHLDDILRCAPRAVAATKDLLRQVPLRPLDPLLDDAARLFARALRGDEASEGLAAFADRRPPSWRTTVAQATVDPPPTNDD